MSGMKNVFLPMPLTGFVQSFQSNIMCGRKAAWPCFSLNEGFVGRISSSGRFSFYYHQSHMHGISTVLAGKIEEHKGGLLLSYRYRKPVFATVLCSYTIVFSLVFLITSLVLMKDVSNYSFLSAPIMIFAMALMFLFVKTKQAKQRLLQKLNEVCCGLLLEGNKNEI